ncbi:MAG: D-alanyl-D-alanine carboxypeptidase/D-alanyl-D-alanine-endopeptidase [Pyrinomonadaceae bacterium]|nr:D-alanyl-D-alanine carboxypeptidase/D-alanyl-D-alanine-endopeptidase [Pyrinomonadaceae bacterium]
MTSCNHTSKLVSLVLLTALAVGSVPLATAQQSQRDRRVVAQPTPTPTATRTPVPSPSPSPTPNAAPNGVLAPRSTLTPSPRIATTTRTLEELRARIAEVLQKPELAPAIVAIKVTSLETGKVLFEENGSKLLRPASNMKLYTVAAALDRLSPDYRFVTSVYAAARPDPAGIMHGDLTIYGRGDPSIAARFNGGDYFKGINDLAAQIASSGVKRVEGDLVGDETYFTGPRYGSGWDWEDLQWWYGAEVSALTVNDNALDLFVKPGSAVGLPAVITTGPPDPLLAIVNRVVTAAKGSKRELTLHRGLGADVLEIYGSIPLDDRGYAAGVGISHPGLLFVYLLRSSLAQRGVIFTGKSRTVPAPAYVNGPVTSRPAGSFEIASMQSPPLSLIAAQTLKPSQNLYTELILRTLGRVVPPSPGSSETTRTSEEAGLEVVKTFLREAGVITRGLALTDGSGLSRNDMITAEASIQLLTYMGRHRYAGVFREALPIAGVDGTLRNRMKGTPAENNVRAKTGSLSSAASLAGYLTTVSGENLVFSIMVNNYPVDTDVRSLCIDPITVLLASFSGRS